MSKFAQKLEPQAEAATTTDSLERWLPWLVGAGAIFVLFYQLGGAALFEPDEGRNAEKARQILLLGDWVTPHENFHPVLDKPIFFYWLIALCYKLFGISEWAARLPSALAALGCVMLVYAFARIQWGKAQALWSSLILLTSLEFFLLARLVIFDMALTFLLTLALCAFYLASQSNDAKRRRALCLLMYASLAAATLLKGLIGVVLPGMVIFAYLLLTQRWSLLRRLYLVPGALIFLAIVLPWYLEMGARHEGYLRYYFWDEHVGRFASDKFGRNQPWYYFIFVALIGFFPWSLVGPFLVGSFRPRPCDDKTLFLLLWVGLPLLFFSVSMAKLPHYILPIFPALALLTAARLVDLFSHSLKRAQNTLSLAWIGYWAMVLYFLAGHWQPAILPQPIVASVTAMPRSVWLLGVALLFLVLPLSSSKIRPRTQGKIFLAQTIAMIGFVTFTAYAMVAASSVRSAKTLGEKIRPFMVAATQVVFYDVYFGGIGFYLASEKPAWVVTPSKRKRSFLGNYYALAKRAEPETQWGKTRFDFDEFPTQWRRAREPLLVLTKAKNRARLERQVGETAKFVTGVDGYVWLMKQ